MTTHTHENIFCLNITQLHSKHSLFPTQHKCFGFYQNLKPKNYTSKINPFLHQCACAHVRPRLAEA